MKNDNVDQVLISILDSAPIPSGVPVQYGGFDDFIESINLPHQITVGEEIVSTNRPFVVLRRKRSDIEEFFSKPYFFVTRKIRLVFHWEGIHVLGANMEAPNCFILPVPKINKSANWYFKISCLPNCAPGKKPLYVSVGKFRENLILKGISVLAKIIASFALIAMVMLPFLYFISDTVRMYINNAVIGESSTGFITVASLIMFSIIVFSKRFDEIFSTLQQDKGFLILVESGEKMINPSGIQVIKPLRDN